MQCTFCNKEITQAFCCDELTGEFCESCFSVLPCGNGQHDEGCTTTITEMTNPNSEEDIQRSSI